MINDSGVRFNATATDATSAVASASAVAGRTYYITDIAGGSDKAGGLILVKDGTTLIWQARVSNTSAFAESFESPLKATAGAAVSVTVDGTAACYANIGGYYLP